MAKVKYKTVGTGVFWSPALERDADYELLETIEKRVVTGKAVRCVESGEVYDLSVLTKPTDAQMIDQVAAAFREIGAWLVANAPDNPSRHRAALRAIRRSIRDNYLADDLDRDVVWIGGADFGARIAFLRDHLLTEGRLAGWTPDWYAGFPAYRFYMVVPSLAIVGAAYALLASVLFAWGRSQLGGVRSLALPRTRSMIRELFEWQNRPTGS